ncbi:glycosyltransferase, partial [Candidatus Pelagibacter ubique]|nr:glycosyltransferase [Candidatus Pelagibacter ubique]
ELLKINFFKYLYSTVVPVLYPKLKEVKIDELSLNRKNFKILYVSRIVKNKNLDFCLTVLKKLNLKVDFTIIGPIEDKKYWLMCKKKIFDLKNKIKVNYLGYQKKNKINKIMKKSHCLFLPSMFESFGHVIFESFLNGLPVITSKNTPWNKLKSKKIGADIDIANDDIYVSELKSLMTCDGKNYRSMRVNALGYSKKIINQNTIYKNKNIF